VMPLKNLVEHDAVEEPAEAKAKQDGGHDEAASVR
jgi:hypothetical protein